MTTLGETIRQEHVIRKGIETSNPMMEYCSNYYGRKKRLSDPSI